jgi:hypothetical protein
MRKHRPHPLQTFRFWFVVFGTIGAAAAWKLDLLPFRRPDTAVEVVSVDTNAESTGTLSEDPPADVLLGQSEPGASETAENTAAGGTAAVVAVGDGLARPTSPFGPARPEFMPAPETAVVEAGGVGPEARVRGVIIQTSSTEDASLGGETETGPFVQSDVTPDGPARSQRVVEGPVGTAPAETHDFAEIDGLLAAGTAEGDVSAHRTLSKLYWEQPDLRPQLMSRIEGTARKIYFQPQPHYMDAYEIQAGDRLQDIAKGYQISWEYLARLNRADPRRIREGQKLKVIKGPFGAVIDLSDYELTLHAHGHFVYRFPVGIGKDGSTPTGTFAVQEKLVDPTYYGPEGVVANDDPANPLGERWIGIGDSYGIHGTIEPETIGQSASRGCIRLLNKDVEIVYDLLTVGSEVVVRR